LEIRRRGFLAARPRFEPAIEFSLLTRGNVDTKVDANACGDKFTAYVGVIRNAEDLVEF